MFRFIERKQDYVYCSYFDVPVRDIPDPSRPDRYTDPEPIAFVLYFMCPVYAHTQHYIPNIFFSYIYALTFWPIASVGCLGGRLDELAHSSAGSCL